MSYSSHDHDSQYYDERTTSFSDPGHSSTGISYPALTVLSQREREFISAPVLGQAPHTHSALLDPSEDAEREDGPPSELHFSLRPSSFPPPLPPSPASPSQKRRSISIVTPDEYTYRERYSASEPGHGHSSRHAPKPFSIRRKPPPSYTPSLLGHSSSASLETNMLRLHERTSTANLAEPHARERNLFSHSNASAAQQNRSSVASRTSTRNKLRKPPPSGHARSASSVELARPQSILRPTKSILTIDLTYTPPDTMRMMSRDRQRTDSEMGYLSDAERRMSVTQPPPPLPPLPASSIHVQRLQHTPSRQPTFSSSESSGSRSSGDPERGRRPRHSAYRSSSTTNTTSTHVSSSEASTAATSMSLHNLSSSDWAGKFAKDEGGGTRSQSPPRKLVKKRGPQVPEPAPKKEPKRSRSILGLRMSFMRGKEKEKERKMSLDEGHLRTSSVHDGLPPLSASPPLWVGAQVLHPFSSPKSDASPSTAPFLVSPSTPGSPSYHRRPTSRFRRTSTHALETLALTDPHALSSSAVAELTSRLSIMEDQDRHGLGLGLPEDWHKYATPLSREGSVVGFDEKAFDPYLHTSDARPRPRPPKEKNQREVGAAAEMRRWTLAMTDVSDEVLLDELERLRRWSRPPTVSRGRKVKSVEGHQHDRYTEFGVGPRKHSKTASRSVGGHEFVFGGPSGSRAGRKFNVGSDEGGEEDCSDDESSQASFSSDEEHEDEDEPEFSSLATSSPSPDSDWTTIRHALLCCRDIIRTERSYLSHLHHLASLVYPSSFSSSSPSHETRTRILISTYLPDLVSASEAFLARLEDDPSAWGVSAALIGCEEEMEGAFVRWCGVVGEVFLDPPPATASSSSSPSDSGVEKAGGGGGLRSRVSSTVGFGLKGRSKSGLSVGVEQGGGDVKSVYATKQTRSRAASCYDGQDFSESSHPPPPPPPLPLPPFPSRPLPPPPPLHSGMFTAALGTGLALGISPPPSSSPPPHHHTNSKTALSSSTTTLSRTFTFAAWRKSTVALSESQSTGSLPVLVDRGHRGGGRGGKAEKVKTKAKAKRAVTLRELAIQPTQRVMRYVLQYRDLLKHTPASSPSRALVERAVEGALRIAQRCDRAQGNAAFLRPGPGRMSPGQT
ncbi:hypothetical protein BXZ70DRAFT_219141 [Cristinia sonorae]|uniref:DH domain-containing protein n=1 Tax=Cristinia sonorae TaxID=1940300 RepID=A0A8K0XPD1_9AGAR|nr:hypothetical protein BXZ70DRAFT_219141 [Cristinia sonorae]